MKVISIRSENSGWDSFVESHPDATFYHQLQWKTVFTKSFGHSCHYLAAIGDDGEWQGVLPLVHMRSGIFGNFLVSQPFVNYGGLLVKSDASARRLLDEAEQLRRSCGAAYVELRHLARNLDGLPTKQHKVTMILDLAKSADIQWQSFNAKLRNQIRKAEKNELRFVIGHLDQLDGFYDVFSRNMRDLGTPVYAKRFFHVVLETFPTSTWIFSVYHQDKAIAAGIACGFRDTLEVPWASSIRDYKALCPNNMLYWEAIEFAIDRGYRKFDFGRSSPHEGTYNFKEQWGAKPVQLYWQYLMENGAKMPELNPSNRKYQTAIRIWRRLPLPLTKFLGPLIVRSIP